MEPITVCENVCRDFIWLPSLLSLLADFGTFLVACAAVAAVLAYPWQKTIDRKNTQRDELRRELRLFLESWFKVIYHIDDAEDILKRLHDEKSGMLQADGYEEFSKHVKAARRVAEQAVSSLALCAPPETLVAAMKLQDSYFQLLDEIRKPNDTKEEVADTSKVVLTRFLDAVASFRKASRKHLGEFIGVSRKTEFDLHTYNEITLLSPRELRERQE